MELENRVYQFAHAHQVFQPIVAVFQSKRRQAYVTSTALRELKRLFSNNTVVSFWLTKTLLVCSS